MNLVYLFFLELTCWPETNRLPETNRNFSSKDGLIGDQLFSPKSCLALCDPMDCSTPSFPVLHYLPEFAQTHVHRIGDGDHRELQFWAYNHSELQVRPLSLFFSDPRYKCHIVFVFLEKPQVQEGIPSALLSWPGGGEQCGPSAPVLSPFPCGPPHFCGPRGTSASMQLLDFPSDVLLMDQSQLAFLQGGCGAEVQNNLCCHLDDVTLQCCLKKSFDLADLLEGFWGPWFFLHYTLEAVVLAYHFGVVAWEVCIKKKCSTYIAQQFQRPPFEDHNKCKIDRAG